MVEFPIHHTKPETRVPSHRRKGVASKTQASSTGKALLTLTLKLCQ